MESAADGGGGDIIASIGRFSRPCRVVADRSRATLERFPLRVPLSVMAEFISRISVVCFAASYSVALGFEVTRLWFRSSVRGATMIGFVAAGLIAQTLYLVWRAATVTAIPLSSGFDWYLLAAWVLAAGSLWMTIANPRTPVGLFVLPVVLGLIGAAELSSREPFPQNPATQIWGAIHGSFNLAMSVAVVLGGLAGGMWLIQAGRLARKQAPLQGFRMPSLEKLSLWSARMIVVAAWAGGSGFLSGIILNAVNRQRGLLETVPWTDPVVLRMGMLVLWLISGVVISRAVARQANGRRVTAVVSLVSLCLLTASILWGVFGSTRHGVPPQQAMPTTAAGTDGGAA